MASSSWWINIIYLLLILVIVSLAVASNDPRHQNSSSPFEREALLSTGWWEYDSPPFYFSKQNHCEWTGILCNEAGRVVSISLGSFFIDDELGKLNFSSFPYLQTLDLSYCELNGSIPYQIGMLSKLKYLSLFNNYLTGKIPSSLGNLTQLQTLDLSHNLLSGFIPNELGTRGNFVSLDLEENHLTGEVPSALGSLTQLNYLDLSYNRLTGPIPVFKNCSSLQSLDLSQNLLSGHIPEELGNCSSLKFVYLTGNNLIGGVPDTLCGLSNLIIFDLKQNCPDLNQGEGEALLRTGWWGNQIPFGNTSNLRGYQQSVIL